jgi:hypothetical protein
MNAIGRISLYITSGIHRGQHGDRAAFGFILLLATVTFYFLRKKKGLLIVVFSVAVLALHPAWTIGAMSANRVLTRKCPGCGPLLPLIYCAHSQRFL